MPPKPLNQYAVSQVLGSEVKRYKRHRFGGFGLPGNAAEVAKARLGDVPKIARPSEYDAKLVEAFEQMRDGYAPGRILWDTAFANRFVERCRALGADLPDAALKRRLITIRKNTSRFKKAGISLSPTTKREPHPGIVQQHAPAIEFALVRLRYRHGASIDDILLEPELGEEFERTARDMGSALPAEELRLGALNLRKSRYFSKGKLSSFQQMDSTAIEAAMTDLGRSSEITGQEVHEGPGILEVVEPDRYLFLSEHRDVRAAIVPFIGPSALASMADGFWEPDPDEIHIRLFAGSEFQGVRIRNWQIKLIYEMKPVFNWPVAGTAA